MFNYIAKHLNKSIILSIIILCGKTLFLFWAEHYSFNSSIAWKGVIGTIVFFVVVFPITLQGSWFIYKTANGLLHTVNHFRFIFGTVIIMGGVCFFSKDQWISIASWSAILGIQVFMKFKEKTILRELKTDTGGARGRAGHRDGSDDPIL